MPSERGQTTVEWTGLLLLVTLVLGAVATFAPSVGDRAVGRALARRIACAARGACGLEAPNLAADASASTRRLVASAPASSSPRVSSAPASSAPRVSSAPPASSSPPAAPSKALRGARYIAKRAWIVCLGYRRYRYERAHPGRVVMGRGIPVGEALKIANGCLN